MSSYGPASEDGDDDRPSRFSHDYDNSAIHPIPRRTLLAIEYPGYIDRSTADSSARSLQRAISTLGGPRHLQSYLVSSPSTPNLELNYGRLSEDGREHVVPSRWKHPIPASAAQGDKLVVRVRKRTKVRVWRDSSGVERRDRIDAGEFTVDMVGCVAKTLRFRSIADYQYRQMDNTPETDLNNALASLDYNTLVNFQFPPEQERYTVSQPGLEPDAMSADDDDDDGAHAQQAPQKVVSVSNMAPPPRFTPQVFPHVYNYKANNQSVLTNIGGERARLVNRVRYRGFGVTSIRWDSPEEVPSEPSESSATDRIDEDFLHQLEMLFADPDTYPDVQSRPIWSRIALTNVLAGPDTTETTISNLLRIHLPRVSFLFPGGPFRDFLVRLGYDPRKDPTSRFYQGVQLRLVRKSGDRYSTKNRQEGSSKPGGLLEGGDAFKSHIFNGKILHKEWSNFQFCDITDPQIVKLVNDPKVVRQTATGEQGWYRSSRIQLIKAVLRHKYTHLLLSGLPAPLEECEEIINASLAADDGGDGGGSDGDEDEEGGKDARSMASKRDPFAKTRLAAAEGGTGLGGVGLSVRPHLSMRRRAGNLRVGGGAGGAPEVGEEEAVAARLRRQLAEEEPAAN